MKLRRLSRLLFVSLLASACAGAAFAGLTSGPQPRPLLTAIADPATFGRADSAVAFRRLHLAGGRVVRLALPWDAVAPASPPGEFDPANPNDPAYSWSGFDAQVQRAVANSLEPLIVINDAPDWAENRPADAPAGTRDWRVSPGEFAKFALAAARRYSGSMPGLPRVRYWQAWNEPNLSTFLNPQLNSQLTRQPTLPFEPADVVSADLYRLMVNAFAGAVHSVSSDNIVVAGGLEPFSGTSGVVAIGPLLFMRKLLCLSTEPVPRPTCTASVHFDAWSVHPYTAGDATHHARLPDDVSLGDLGRVNALLEAAVAAGHVTSDHPVQLWVTEFGWDTKPPDSGGVPLELHARWVAEALYRMWTAGVSVVTWFGLRDERSDGRPEQLILQSGLYFRGETLALDRPKPALAAFRFPFVAYTTGPRIQIWGRTPWGTPGAVVVEQSTARGWRRLGVLHTDGYGIFRSSLRRAGTGLLVRARLVDGSFRALPFSLRRPPDLPVNPFGGPNAGY